MQDKVDLSIVVVTRNRSSKLQKCIDKILTLQTSFRIEVVVADNLSSDTTQSVIAERMLEDARLKYLLVTTIGSGAAKDVAWRHTTGDIVAFTDDDCYVAPTYADAIVSSFKRRPRAGCIGGRILLYDPLDAPVTIDLRDYEFRIDPYQFIPGGEIQGANFAFRRSALIKINGFDQMLGAGAKFAGEDIDAVAATLWEGLEVHFDPSIVVSHHHGRRGAEVKKIGRSYDYGRGAYYAKYILRADTRSAFIAGWKNSAVAELPIRRSRSIAARVREIISAVRYLHALGAYRLMPSLLLRSFVYLLYLMYRVALQSIGR